MSLSWRLAFVASFSLAPSLATPVPVSMRGRSKNLHHDLPELKKEVTNDTLSLKRMQMDLPAADEGSSQGVAKGSSHSLPVYVPGDGVSGNRSSLVKRNFQHNLTASEVSQLDYSRSHGLADSGAHCTPLNTIFDMGFYDGADSRTYLSGGYCVVGVEADPDLVAVALQHYAVWVANGQLQLANVAIAPQGDTTSWTVFYRNKCSKEWNSFIKTVGCRACLPPHAVDLNACEQVKVTSTDCAGIFGYFGVPHYLKLDIEGAETGCFDAMKRLPIGTTIPHYLSTEVTQLEYIDALYQLGYKGFKLVRQDRLATATGSTSGPWGENALDCATGPVWRNYAQIRTEFSAILAKDLVPTDPCPGGVMPIHGSPKLAAAYMWYDLHATVVQPVR